MTTLRTQLNAAGINPFAGVSTSAVAPPRPQVTAPSTQALSSTLVSDVSPDFKTQLKQMSIEQFQNWAGVKSDGKVNTQIGPLPKFEMAYTQGANKDSSGSVVLDYGFGVMALLSKQNGKVHEELLQTVTA